MNGPPPAAACTSLRRRFGDLSPGFIYYYCGITVLEAGQMSLVTTLSDIPAASAAQDF